MSKSQVTESLISPLADRIVRDKKSEKELYKAIKQEEKTGKPVPVLIDGEEYELTRIG